MTTAPEDSPGFEGAGRASAGSGMTPQQLTEFVAPLLSHVREGAVVFDEQRVVIYVNPAAERLLGIPRSELLGRRCAGGILCHVGESGRCLCNTEECPIQGSFRDGFTRHGIGHLPGDPSPVGRLLTEEVPLWHGGRVVAVVDFLSEPPAAEPEPEEEAARTRRYAYEDALTQLPNRRFLQQRLDYLISKLHWQGRTFAVLMIDIDHFKRVNDRYGHAVGDLVLKEVARVLGASVRPIDTVGRWGGEEFLLLVPNVDANTLTEVAERLRMLVMKASVNLPTGLSFGVTISLGATQSRLDDTPETLLERADALLYQSKRAGRNRVSTHFEELSGIRRTLTPTPRRRNSAVLRAVGKRS